MEKITKKKKAKKGLKKRIGLFAIGGLSLVLTICLSVGATLAWFAGSTWASNQLYMGGPVYVEMAGRGKANGTNADGTSTNDAKWIGGAGSLDIKAAAARTTGTSTTAPGATGVDTSKVLLPGEKFQIYSQARVFSTLTTTSVGTNQTASSTSGANVTNTSKNGTAHVTNNGRITSTTTSVLRARFSVSVEFDPSVGFNNFTGTDYMENYPKQSTAYTGARAKDTKSESATGNFAEADIDRTGLPWKTALEAKEYKEKEKKVTGEGSSAVGTIFYDLGSRRDAVPNTSDNTGTGTEEDPITDYGDYAEFTDSLSGPDLTEIKNGTKRSIYSWKFVSKSVYEGACIGGTDGGNKLPVTVDSGIDTTGVKYPQYARMAAPFDGTDKVGQNGYYGVWILGAADSEKKASINESDSFYKARCNAYIDSYVEEYITEYGEVKTRTIGESLQALENSLNQSFVNLVNDSSDKIIAGYVHGMTVNNNGDIVYAEDAATDPVAKNPTPASWLYIDPTIGNDTNTNELSTGTGGWWYLVSSENLTTKEGDPADYGSVTNETNKVSTVSDDTATGVNIPKPGTPFKRNDIGYSEKDSARLQAKLFEINPLVNLSSEIIGKNGASGVTKVVSYAFPFVNGSSALPGDALTNVFANAKITFQISFQALQAFFPYSTTIDDKDYTDPLLGTAKALNIANAIPIFNEAFDYQENIDNDTIKGL